MEQPSEEEREWYYHGLGGGQLIARTSSVEQPWSMPLEHVLNHHWKPGKYPSLTPKRYAAAGAHHSDAAIVQAIRAVLPQIQEELDLSGIDWTWFTGIRIGVIKYQYDSLAFDLNKDFPLVILVHVAAGSTTFDLGSRVSWAIKGILDRHDLSSIHVEMREGEVFQQSVPKELGPAIKRDTLLDNLNGFVDRNITQALFPLLSYLGWPLQRTSSTGNVGTVGLYIRLGGIGEEGKNLALTCYHVLAGQKMPDWTKADNKKSIKDGKPELAVSQADDNSYREIIHQLRRAQEKIQVSIDNLRSSAETLTERERNNMTSLTNSQQYVKQLLEIIQGVNDDFTGRPDNSTVKNSGLKKRQVGKVWTIPEYAVSASDNPDFKGFLNDWVLLSIASLQDDGATNEFYIPMPDFITLISQENSHMHEPFLREPLLKASISPSSVSSADLDEAVQEHRDRQCFLKLRNSTSKVGRITDRESQGPGNVRVVKRGMNGLTFGMTNGIEACIRAKKSGEPASSGGTKGAAHTWEIIVIPPPAANQSFSRPGDSGSSVVEANGNVVGMLVSGGESGRAREQEWRGYAAYDDPILPTSDPDKSPRRKSKGFEKGKEPAEAQAKPQGPVATGEYEPYFEGIWLSFVTPMEFILEDIKRVTGQEVNIIA